MKSLPIFLATVLAGCAAAPMQPDAYKTYLDKDVAVVQALPLCCQSWRDVDFSRQITSEVTDVHLGSPGTRAKDFGGFRAPVVGFRVPSERPAELEFLSFSDDRHSAIRFDNRLFVRPNAIFLDADFNVVGEVENPLMCAGHQGNGFALWHRFAIDKPTAKYVVFYSSVQRATQAIDTRTSAFVPPGIELIAELRGQTYLSTLNIGYTGLIGVRYVKPESPEIGRCVQDEPVTPMEPK